jgi:hypothetical protein
VAETTDAGVEMNMTQTQKSGVRSSAPSTIATGSRKTYRRPVLRVLGAVHVLTRGTGVTQNGDAGQSMRVNSDRALKQDAVRVGEHPLGFGLYLFDYRPAYRERCGHGRQFGVMADEVETVVPDAVSTGPDGYKLVDYSLLGITRAAH